MPTILQLTDLHLMANPVAELKGVRTREITEGVIKEVRQGIEAGRWSFDRIIITGDLAHDELRETYFILRELLGDLMPHCQLLPGNHDSRPFMREVFPELFAADDEFLTFSISVGAWRLIGLDSHIPGKVPGHVDQQQLDWLADQLRQHADQPTVLFLHHPPFNVGSAWVDAIGLQNADDLMQCVAKASQLQAISTGHVHQDFETKEGGVRFLTTPSASLQFSPNSENFDLDAQPAGFRILHLGDHFESEVVRVSQ